VGSLGYRHHLPAVVRMVADGALDPELLISDVVPLVAAGDLIASMAADPGERIKVLVDVR
jgi:threonine dehydrogenase-like Zn-dependent dehydrogenase